MVHCTISMFVVALVGFEIQNITVQESSGEVTFRVLKTGIADVQLTVLFTTEDLDAKGKTLPALS